MLPPDLTRNTTNNSNLKYPEDVTAILDILHRLRLTEANKAIKIQTTDVSLSLSLFCFRTILSKWRIIVGPASAFFPV